MNFKIWMVAVVASFSLAACGDSDDNKDKGGGGKCEDRAITMSCDVGISCVGYSTGALTEDQIKTTCGAGGTFAAAPCATSGDDYVGSCDLGCPQNTNHQVAAYYFDTPPSDDILAGIVQGCEAGGGTWTAAK